jgi:hypothetical protein
MLDRMEVLKLGAHLLISIVVLLLYGYTVAIGKPDTTLQNFALLIGGYWFGAMGNSAVKKLTAPRSKKDDSTGV